MKLKPYTFLLSAAALFALFSVLGIVTGRREPAVIWAGFAFVAACVALGDAMARTYKKRD